MHLETLLDWKTKLVDAYMARSSDAPRARPAFGCGTSEDAIGRLEELLNCHLPMSLRSLLLQTDGVKEEIELEPGNWIIASIVIYSVEEMIDNNVFMRREYADRDAGRYLFSSTAGVDGIQFGSIATIEQRQDTPIFAWYPDQTPDKRMSDGLLPFLMGWCEGRSTV